jgi:hypothetical protein
MIHFNQGNHEFPKMFCVIGSDINAKASIIHRGRAFPEEMSIKLIQAEIPSLRDFFRKSFS